MRCWYWKIPCNNACGCRCHMSDNVWAEAYFCFNTGIPTLAPTGPQFELGNKKNKPSWRLGFEVFLKSLRFSPCGHLSAATNKRGFVGSSVGLWWSLLGQVILCWVPGRNYPIWCLRKCVVYICVCMHHYITYRSWNPLFREADLFRAKQWCEQQQWCRSSRGTTTASV